MRISIFKKIFISQFTLIIIASGCISLASYLFMVRQYKESQNDTLRIISSATAMRVSNKVAQHRAIFKEIAESKEVALYAQKFQELLLAKHLDRHREQFPILAYVNQEGAQEFRLVNGQASEDLETLADQKIFRTALAAPNQVILGEMALDPVLKTHALQFAYARIDYFGDQFLGLIFGQAPLANIVAPAANCVPTKKGYCLIVAQDGTILSAPEAKNALQPVVVGTPNLAALFAKAETEPNGQIRHAVVNGEECYFSVSLIPGTSWLAMAVLPSRQYSAVPTLFRNFSIGLFLGLLLLAGIITFFLARSFTSPIRKLALASTALAQGDFAQRVDAGKDEIGDLAQSFNSMAEQLGTFVAREKQLLTAEAAARLKAELADQHKSEFLSKISHELRTPLNIVLGMAELLDNGAQQDEKSYQKILAIKEAGRNLLHLIDGILDFSRLESGTISLTPAPFDLFAILGRLKKKYEPAARAKGLTLLYMEADAVPTTVVGDEGRIFQVLENLLDNAVKYTAHGEISLRVRPLTLKASNDGHIIHLRFEVADTGCGIPLEQQTAMFESFKQIDPYATRKAGGLGIGLTISQQLIELMHGEISMKSEPGQGSTFYVDLALPVAKEEASSATVEKGPEIPPSETTEHFSGGKGMNILVAEDNPVNQKLLRLMLEMHGHHVLVTADGKEAVAVFQSEHIDLVLMDVQMPGMNGFEATAAIRELEIPVGNHVPIIAVTAHVMPGYKEECLKAGMDNYLSKPFRMQELFAIIDETLAQLNNPA